MIKIYDDGMIVITPKHVMYPAADYMEAGKTHPTNCQNCGAVLHGYVCEYCGTDNLNVRRDE